MDYLRYYILKLSILINLFRIRNADKWPGLPHWFMLLFARFVLLISPSTTLTKCQQIRKGDKIMFICNHQLWGIELPVLLANLYLHTGLWPRSIADRGHFKLPLWRNILTFFGAIYGSHEVLEQAMNANHPILILPGGGNEVMRNLQTAPYTLKWENRTGFAKFAIDHGYKLVPLSCIGTEEIFVHFYDLPAKWMFWIINDPRAKKDNQTIPLCLPTWPRHTWITFGEILDTTQLTDSADEVMHARDVIRSRVLLGIQECLESKNL